MYIKKAKAKIMQGKNMAKTSSIKLGNNSNMEINKVKKRTQKVM